MRLIVAFLVVLASTSAFATGSCMQIFQLGRNEVKVLKDQREASSAISNFCKESAEASAKNRNLNSNVFYDGAKSVFSLGSESSSSMSAKLCEATDSRSAKSNAFELYANTLDRNATEAFKTCVEAEAGQTAVYLPLAVNENTVQIDVGFPDSKPSSGLPVYFQYVVTNATCKWTDVLGQVSRARALSINSKSTATLECERTNKTQGSSITVKSQVAGYPSITLPWAAPEDTKSEVSRLRREKDELTKIVEAWKSTKLSLYTLTVGPGQFLNDTPASDKARQQSQLDEQARRLCNGVNSRNQAQAIGDTDDWTAGRKVAFACLSGAPDSTR